MSLLLLFRIGRHPGRARRPPSPDMFATGLVGGTFHGQCGSRAHPQSLFVLWGMVEGRLPLRVKFDNLAAMTSVGDTCSSLRCRRVNVSLSAFDMCTTVRIGALMAVRRIWQSQRARDSGEGVWAGAHLELRATQNASRGMAPTRLKAVGVSGRLPRLVSAGLARGAGRACNLEGDPQ